MKELREEAKSLGINSFQKTMDVLTAEIAQAKSGNIEGSAGQAVRRTVEDVDQRAEEIRNRRRELGIDPLAPKYKLHQRGQKPGWRYFWATNKENRLLELQEMGYQFDQSVEAVSAGNNSDGLKHIRMMIPESIYKEDFARKMKLIDSNEEAMSKADIKGGLEQKEVADGSHISIGRKTIKLGSTQG